MADSTRSESPVDVDFSVIRTSIDMGHSMMEQILNGVHYGSDEVRNLLYDECDFIMECKVCRNLFRSFPNFVAHKRVYCQETSEEKQERERVAPVRGEEEVVIVEPNAPEQRLQAKSTPAQNNCVQKVIENKFDGKSKDYQFYTKVAENIELRKVSKVTNTVTMTAIPSNSNAVVVSHAKGDHSGKSKPKSTPVRSSEGDSETVSGSSKTSPMMVDDSPPRSKSISSICNKLARGQSAELKSTGLAKQINSRANRRTRKALPRKSTEEFVSFNPKTTTNTIVPIMDPGRNTQQSPDINTDVINKKPDKASSPVVNERSSDSDSCDQNWMIFCDLKKNMCKKCGAVYKTRAQLKNHMKTHGMKVGDYKCPQCSKFMSTAGTVARHMRVTHSAMNSEVRKYLNKNRCKSDRNVNNAVASLADTTAAVDTKSEKPTEKKDNPLSKTGIRHRGEKTTSSSQESIIKFVTCQKKNDSSKETKTPSEKPTTRVVKETGSNALHGKPVTRAQRESNNPNDRIVMKLKVKPAADESAAESQGTPVSLKGSSTTAKESTALLEMSTNISMEQKLVKETMKACSDNDETDMKKYENRRTRNSLNSQEQVDRNSIAEERTIRTSDATAGKTRLTAVEVKEISSGDVHMTDLDDILDQGEETNIAVENPQYNKSLSSPTRSRSVSVPTSPTTSTNSNSMDGYSNKFKMTVQEMAELVECASLTKFAKERKKRAHQLLTKSKSQGKRTIPTRLSKPMKRQLNRTALPVKRSYSTRLSTEDSGGDGKPRHASLTHSKRLQRELKKLANSAGLVESNIYSSSSPSVVPKDSVKKVSESDESASESKKPQKEKLLTPSPADTKGKLGRTEVSSRESSKDRHEKTVSRNVSKDRKESVDLKVATKHELKDKLELESGSRNSSMERKEVSDPRELTKLRAKNESELEKRNLSKERNEATNSKEVAKYGLRDKRESESGSRNTSKERNEIYDPKEVAKYEFRDKIEHKTTPRNASNERGKDQTGNKTEHQSRDRTVSSLKPENQSNSKKETEKKDKGQMIDINHQSTEESVQKKHKTEQEVRYNKPDMNKVNALIRKYRNMINDGQTVKNRESPMKRDARSENKPVGKGSVEEDSKSDAHNHRTRLATGSIFFNSDLLKLSPSKFSDMESSPRKSDKDEPNVRRKLSLSPRKEIKKKKHERTSSAPKMYSLATGVKTCDTCKKVFWKVTSFYRHKCPKRFQKKRTMSSSPKKLGNTEGTADVSGENETKKPRLEVSSSSPGVDTTSSSKGVVRQGNKPDKTLNIHDKDSSKTSLQKKAQTETSSSSMRGDRIKPHQPSTSTDDSLAQNSDNDSEFSGFSESDLLEIEASEEFEESDSEYVDLSSDEVDYIMGTLDQEANKTVRISSRKDDEGLIYKSSGKVSGTSGTVEEIWVERDCSAAMSEDKNSGYRQYVSDPNNPLKIYCQNNKDIDKLIDETDLQCLKCKMQYTSISNLRRHVIRHLGWKRYKCRICMFTCYDRSECRLHYIRTHGNRLDNQNFLQYYIDLKHVASKKRNEKRVTTLRNNKESVKTPEEDTYKRPRQTFVVKPKVEAVNNSATVKETHDTNKNSSDSFSEHGSPRRASKDIPGRVKGRGGLKDSDTSPGCKETKEIPKVHSSLVKARQNLAKALGDS